MSTLDPRLFPLPNAFTVPRDSPFGKSVEFTQRLARSHASAKAATKGVADGTTVKPKARPQPKKAKK